MKLIILEDYEKTSEWAAKYVRNKIKSFNPGPNRYFVLGLPTGSLSLSPFVPFNALRRAYRQHSTGYVQDVGEIL
jgi:6-phosphogluconolactonase/glucosamine-6-phosphate isomerase/deaminase